MDPVTSTIFPFICSPWLVHCPSDSNRRARILVIGGDDPRNLGRSTGTLALGFTTVVVLSLGTDEVLQVLKVYPPWNEPIYDSRFLLALSYRIVYTILGSYIAAKYAPHHPMGHAIALGVVGTVIGVVGAMATIPMHLGPAWYPIAIAATALPCAWLAGVLYRRRHTER